MLLVAMHFYQRYILYLFTRMELIYPSSSCCKGIIMQQKHLITFRHGYICFGLTITCPVSECYYLPSYWQMLRKQELCFLIIGKGRRFFFTPRSSSCTHCHSKYKQYSTTYTITTPGEDQGCLIFFTYVWEGKLYSTNSLEILLYKRNWYAWVGLLLFC